jgi:undecaprenyl-diphosphatase
MTAGLFGGLRRETAARFSFLLAMPITLGAGLLKLREVMKAGIPQEEQMSFILGIALAAIVGYIDIRFLLSFLKNHSLYIFVWYRIIFGALLITTYCIR